MKNKEQMDEKERKKYGGYFTPTAEIQRQEIIKNLNKTSENEKLIRLKWKERR